MRWLESSFQQKGDNKSGPSMGIGRKGMWQLEAQKFGIRS